MKINRLILKINRLILKINRLIFKINRLIFEINRLIFQNNRLIFILLIFNLKYDNFFRGVSPFPKICEICQIFGNDDNLYVNNTNILNFNNS